MCGVLADSLMLQAGETEAKGQMTSAPDKGVYLIIAAGSGEGMVAAKAQQSHLMPGQHLVQ